MSKSSIQNLHQMYCSNSNIFWNSVILIHLPVNIYESKNHWKDKHTNIDKGKCNSQLVCNILRLLQFKQKHLNYLENRISTIDCYLLFTILLNTPKFISLIQFGSSGFRTNLEQFKMHYFGIWAFKMKIQWMGLKIFIFFLILFQYMSWYVF